MSQYDWILDVLADLKSFAEANGLSLLAEQLDDTALIAATEIASVGDMGCAEQNGGQNRVGSHAGGTGRHQSA